MTANLKAHVHPVRHHKIYGDDKHLMNTNEISLLPGSLWVDAQLIMTNLCRDQAYFNMRNSQSKKLRPSDQAVSSSVDKVVKPYQNMREDEDFFDIMRDTPRLNWNELQLMRPAFFPEQNRLPELHDKGSDSEIGLLYDGEWEVIDFWNKTRNKPNELEEFCEKWDMSVNQSAPDYKQLKAKYRHQPWVSKQSKSGTSMDWNSWKWFKEYGIPWMEYIVKWHGKGLEKLFDQDDLVECLKEKQVMFIGDSKVRQVFMTLEGMIKDEYNWLKIPCKSNN